MVHTGGTEYRSDKDTVLPAQFEILFPGQLLEIVQVFELAIFFALWRLSNKCFLSYLRILRSVKSKPLKNHG